MPRPSVFTRRSEEDDEPPREPRGVRGARGQHAAPTIRTRLGVNITSFKGRKIERAPPTEGEARAAAIGGGCVCVLVIAMIVVVAVVASNSAADEPGSGAGGLAATRGPTGTTTISPTASPTRVPTLGPTKSLSPTLSPNLSPTPAPTPAPSSAPATPAPTTGPAVSLVSLAPDEPDSSSSDGDGDGDDAAVERMLLLVGLPIIGVIIAIMCCYFCTVGWSEVKDKDARDARDARGGDGDPDGGGFSVATVRSMAVPTIHVGEHGEGDAVGHPAQQPAQRHGAAAATARSVGGHGQQAVEQNQQNQQNQQNPAFTADYAQTALHAHTSNVGGAMGWAPPEMYMAPETQIAAHQQQQQQQQQQMGLAPPEMYMAPETQIAAHQQQQQQQQQQMGLAPPEMYMAPETQIAAYQQQQQQQQQHMPTQQQMQGMQMQQQAMYMSAETQESSFSLGGYDPNVNHPYHVSDGASPQGQGAYLQSHLAPEANYMALPQQQQQQQQQQMQQHAMYMTAETQESSFSPLLSPQYQPTQGPAPSSEADLYYPTKSTAAQSQSPTAASSGLPPIPGQAPGLQHSVPGIGDLLRPMRDLVHLGGVDRAALKQTDVQLDLYKSSKTAPSGASGEVLYMAPPPNFQQGHQAFEAATVPPQKGDPALDKSSEPASSGSRMYIYRQPTMAPPPTFQQGRHDNAALVAAPPLPQQGGPPTYALEQPQHGQPQHEQFQHQQNALQSVRLQAEQHQQLQQLKGGSSPRPLPPPLKTATLPRLRRSELAPPSPAARGSSLPRRSALDFGGWAPPPSRFSNLDSQTSI